METTVVHFEIDDDCKTMKEYVGRRLQRRISAYGEDPYTIVSDYNSEIDYMRDYHGRELLELLQNADDEILYADKSMVKITFCDDVLSIENDGNSFSREGIDSLVYSHLSAKKARERKTIGNKGLGFRSILSWADSIVIDSGDLHVIFSNEVAQSMLHESMPDIESSVHAPTLSFPKWNDEPAPSDFTTRISIHVKDNEEVRADILYQLSNLKPEILLFLNNITALVIESEEIRRTYKKSKGKLETDVNINQYDENGKCTQSDNWFINKSIDNEIDGQYYSVSIAYLRNNNGQPLDSYLYSYFPTKTKFPFNNLVHADFDLTSNRNSLVDNSPANRAIFNEVARLLVDTAVKVHAKKEGYS